MRASRSGYIKVPGGKVWYQIVGKKSDRTPLVVLHGGPGYPHYYLEPLKGLSSERQVVFYDQLGCGNSERPSNTKLWTVSRFVIELAKIIEFLKLKQYHILGQSWGAALAVSFALKKPKGLVSLVLADPYLSTPVWMRDARKLIKFLPRRTQKLITKYEKDKINTKSYEKAKIDFYERFVRGYKKAPKSIIKTRRGSNNDIYRFMWGPDEFLINGTLKKFDLGPELSKIKVPILLICGRFDEVTPEAIKYFKKLFPNASMKIFEKSAHFPHLTEKGKYLKTLRLFLHKTKL